MPQWSETELDPQDGRDLDRVSMDSTREAAEAQRKSMEAIQATYEPDKTRGPNT